MVDRGRVTKVSYSSRVAIMWRLKRAVEQHPVRQAGEFGENSAKLVAAGADDDFHDVSLHRRLTVEGERRDRELILLGV